MCCPTNINMIDIKLIRENPNLVKENIKKKFQNNKLPIVDEIKKNDTQWRSLKQKADQLRAERNKISKDISESKKEEKNVSKLLKEAKKIPQEIEKIEKQSKKLQEEILLLLKKIPNIIHKSVPIGKNDKSNKEIKKFGKIPKFTFTPKNHVELTENLKIADFDSSARTSGNGFYYLTGDLALLNQAMVRFVIDKMVSKGFNYIETPLMLRGHIINKVTDLHDQENMIYKIQDEDLFLIGTSEHSLIGKYIDTALEKKALPIKDTSYSMCFRKEIGSHGIEEKGIYRTHQFNKVEMIVICKPEESDKYWDDMNKISIEIFSNLELPFRILEICSGDLGDLKYRQVDLEVWSPILKEYYEITSCSNLTDTQARRLNIKFVDEHNNRIHPHTLNNTAIATSRALVAVLENHQQKDGSIKIPKALQKYIGGKKVIQIVK
jgi:seryl-tRNA synthetase